MKITRIKGLGCLSEGYIKRKAILWLWLGVLILIPNAGRAQSWSGIINTSRAAPWSRANVGVPGGIPSASWGKCGSTIAAYGSSGSPGSVATINNAIAACPHNTYLLLGPGTFWLDNSVIIQRSNVVVRGSGPNSTILEFPSTTSECVQSSQDIAICGGDVSPYLYPGKPGYTMPGGTYAFNWIGGFSQGAPSITVASVGSGGINNGDMIVLDQANDTGDNGGEIVCDSGPGSSPQCSQQGGTYSGRSNVNGVDYNQEQNVRVIAGCASTCAGAGPFTLTISPGLYANNWNGTGAVGGFFVKPITMAGFENLTVDNTSAGSNIGISNVDGWWIKNVVSLHGNRNHAWSANATHGEIRDSYFYATEKGLIESYGLELPDSSDNLIENNIFQQVASPFIGAGGSQGNVYGFNFWIDDYYVGASGQWMQQAYMGHDAGNSFNLYEGNQGSALSCDDIHGTSALDTLFRNWLNGRDYDTAGGAGNQPTEQTYPIDLDAYCRGYNIIGNVLGTPGYHVNYQYRGGIDSQPGGGPCDAVIYQIGWGGGQCSSDGTAGVITGDAVVANSLMRWGNYDVATGSVHWDSAESSPAAVTHIVAQSTPGSHSLPASFYYSSKPSFWGSMPWPAIGPDVSGGSGPGGFAYRIPAAACYYATLTGPTDGGGSPLPFDANNCYSSSGPGPGTPPGPPVPPTNLTAVPN